MSSKPQTATHSQTLSPTHRSRVTFNQQPASSPIKYLLQNNIKLNAAQGQRGPEEVQLITRLLKQCTIFQDFDIDQNSLRDVCNGVVLIYCQSPHIMQIKDNEIYLFLQGQGFEYMQNSYQGEYSKKFKIYENNEYIMLRKISTNQYFLSLQDVNARYHTPKKKYQLMVDQNTLIGKITDQLFVKVFQGRINQRHRSVVTFLKKVAIFAGLPSNFFYQFTKFLKDQHRKAGEKVITREQNSKYVYFIKHGEAEMRIYNDAKIKASLQHQNYVIATAKNYGIQKLVQFDSFGMDLPDGTSQLGQKEVICLSDCFFYKIDKRLLAIIITSFELQFQQKSKLWSQVNINNQIKGQSYCSPEKELLLKNVERIRTSERKIRDIKLKCLTNKNKKEDPFTIQRSDSVRSGKESVDPTNTISSNKSTMLMERPRLAKTTDGRFRSTRHIKFYNCNGILDQNKLDIFKKKIEEDNEGKHQQMARINHFEITAIEDNQDQKLSPVLRHSNTNDYRQKLGVTKFMRSFSKREEYQTPNKFIPKMLSKPPTLIGGGYKVDSDMIGVFLDKKIKNDIIRKAQKVLNQNKNMKSLESKNIKRIFAGKQIKFTRQKRQINALSDHDRKTIADDIVDRMSNLRDNPLLLQIQSQRRKMQRQLKLSQRKSKVGDSPQRKFKKEDEHIIIRNNE